MPPGVERLPLIVALAMVMRIRQRQAGGGVVCVQMCCWVAKVGRRRGK